ncbi:MULTISPECIES: flavin reductase family protein [Oceanospirillaceae]|uniref:Flavin reductase family protein n=1 Tax=Oceanobacter antarcticus TaxID=3133425 RepID=A0ABW8NHK4_9GAMM
MTEVAPVVDSLDFRQAISKFTTGIALVSNMLPNGKPYGMTINSLTSISLDPATLLISLKSGTMLDLIDDTGVFGVSILSANQQNISSNFARKEKDEKYDQNFLIRNDVPTLKDCLAWFECTVDKKIIQDDHTLILGKVSLCKKAETELAPLIFFSSSYHFLPATPM